jgi:aerobic-type carbon monoxide dehydrogenase small subunit (CoxS/CutS family)
MIKEISTTDITVTINNIRRTLLVGPDESLLDGLRRAAYFSVKSGCDDGSQL